MRTPTSIRWLSLGGFTSDPKRSVRLLMIGVQSLAASSHAVAAPCPTRGDATARITTVEPRLELRLDDGRLLRLVGLDPPLPTPTDPDLGEIARVRLAAGLVGRDVTLRVLADADRWGRLPALVFPAGISTPTGPVGGGVAASAIAAGLGRYLSEPAAHGCRDALTASEATARLAKLGLWADPYYAVLAVDDGAGFMERSGTIVLAEGRLAAVQPGPYRTTLRFAAPDRTPSRQGSYGGRMLVATILPRAMKTFEAQRVDVRALIGRKVRLRGLLDLRFGPRIELVSPDDIDPFPDSTLVPAEVVAPSHSN